MPFVRKLIAEFDANVEFAKPVTRPLRYISAGDVLAGAGASLDRAGIAATRREPTRGREREIRNGNNQPNRRWHFE